MLMLMVMWVVDHSWRFDTNTIVELLAVGGFFVMLLMVLRGGSVTMQLLLTV